jgi:exodeoxyribonuclease VII small subunit
MTTKVFDYESKKNELESIMAWFEGADVTIDESLKKYEQAEKIIIEMEAYLADKKMSIQKIIDKSKG